MEAGVLTFDASSSDDEINIVSTGPGSVELTFNGNTQTLGGVVNGVIVNGLAGDDTITVDVPASVSVQINGGAGNDTITGGAGNDILEGGSGVDTITGNAGDDEIWAGTQSVVDTDDNFIFGGIGSDTIHGGNGVDDVSGGSQSDTCLLYTSPSPRDLSTSRMPSSA